ncbi:hypothetical protein HCN44_007735 [Aphidius gifuensis]|uniref:GTP-binding protein middle domain-containing protein n=1 Tax=Aphidius gifuensis TaxID=684658 RepID=A0A834XLL9_APHGI|nr:hypothetical protein HCN44_007735 [Aphidius gifuensis]
MCISIITLKKDYIFGKGNLDMLIKKVRSNSKITAVFIKIKYLQELFDVSVYDSIYDLIVIQIFCVYAQTTEAKLQVALAELPYIWTKLNWTAADSGGRINLSESRRMILHSRESNLKNSLKKLKEHRKLIRQHRKNPDIPSVAVVGYTNSGKTYTTAYEGILPCKLKILYVNTIGFIQDIPEGLIEPFIATFEDALLSDVIVHVYVVMMLIHVKETFTKIMSKLLDEEKPVIEVANKSNLIPAGKYFNCIINTITWSTVVQILRPTPAAPVAQLLVVPTVELRNIGDMTGPARCVAFIRYPFKRVVFGNYSYDSGAITDGTYHMCCHVAGAPEQSLPAGTHVALIGDLRRNNYDTLILHVVSMAQIDVIDVNGIQLQQVNAIHQHNVVAPPPPAVVPEQQIAD